MRNILIASAFALVGLSAAPPSQACRSLRLTKPHPRSRSQQAAAAAAFIGDRMADAGQTAAPMRTPMPIRMAAAIAGGATACASATESTRGASAVLKPAPHAAALGRASPGLTP
jgi:hypothetical protein